MSNFDYTGYFITPIYVMQKNEWVKDLNKASDKLIKESKKQNKLKRTKAEYKRMGDLFNVHHSPNLTNINEFNEIKNFVLKQAFTILDHMGYNVSNHRMFMSEMWVQEFAEKGGGSHTPHLHPNNHISGFYFLKCSSRTSFPAFYDPRQGKRMISLPEKNKENITFINDAVNIRPTPGTLILFPSFLEHSFPIDEGLDKFRFMHFNIQAVDNNVF